MIARYWPFRQPRNWRPQARWRWLEWSLAIVVFWFLSILIVAYPSFFPSVELWRGLNEGDLAPMDIIAPRDAQFVSQIRTEEQRQLAAAAVPPIYDAPDPEIARIQADRARQIFAFIEDIRRDNHASNEQKSADLALISDLSLAAETRQSLLVLSPERWSQVQLQIVSVLERVMRDSIREEDLPLIHRERVPLAVSLTFSAAEAAIIVDVATDLVRFNTRQNPERTAELRQSAQDAVEPVTRSFISGERIVSAQERIDALQLEALRALGLTQLPENRWQMVAQVALASALFLSLCTLYLWRWPRARLRAEGPRFFAILVAMTLFLLAARILAEGDRIYAFPAAAIALIFVGLMGIEGAILSALGLSLLLTLIAGGSLEVGVMFLAGGLTGAAYLRRTARISEYFVVGIIIALVHIATLTLFNFARGVEQILFYSALGGILSSFLALGGLYTLTLVFNLPTSFKLSELARPSQPLLQRLLREAPGTYTHSLQVANLAEQAAQSIGADAELVHVASLYHDIGKVFNPAFFIENQADMGNPHDSLDDPYRSADILIDHVREGDRLAKEERLPQRIRDFIREHHGTMLSDFFYQRAREQRAGEEVEVAAFRYPGPRPRSRETALLMLADSSEAATRARNPQSRAEVAKIVQQIFQVRCDEGELDDSPLTLKELRIVREVFVDMLQATFHPRIEYPPASDAEAVPETSDDEGEGVAPVTTPPDSQLPAAPLPTAAPDETSPEDEETPLAEVPPLRRRPPGEPKAEGLS